MKELIERINNNIRWLERDGFTTSVRTLSDAKASLEQQAKQIEELKREAKFNFDQYQDAARLLCRESEKIEELAAALAEKDAALSSLIKWHLSPHGGLVHLPTVENAERAIAIQPHAAIVNKIKADAMREVGKRLFERGLIADPVSYSLDKYADRIERGED